MSSAAEDVINLANTDAWIKDKPITVSLTRKVRVPDGAGGFREDSEQVLDSQMFRITENSMSRTSDIVTDKGSRVPKQFTMVGYPNSDIQEDDTFEYMGSHFKVDYVKVEHFQRTAAEVSEIG